MELAPAPHSIGDALPIASHSRKASNTLGVVCATSPTELGWSAASPCPWRAECRCDEPSPPRRAWSTGRSPRHPHPFESADESRCGGVNRYRDQPGPGRLSYRAGTRGQPPRFGATGPSPSSDALGGSAGSVRPPSPPETPRPAPRLLAEAARTVNGTSAVPLRMRSPRRWTTARGWDRKSAVFATGMRYPEMCVPLPDPIYRGSMRAAARGPRRQATESAATASSSRGRRRPPPAVEVGGTRLLRQASRPWSASREVQVHLAASGI